MIPISILVRRRKRRARVPTGGQAFRTATERSTEIPVNLEKVSTRQSMTGPPLVSPASASLKTIWFLHSPLIYELSSAVSRKESILT